LNKAAASAKSINLSRHLRGNTSESIEGASN